VYLTSESYSGKLFETPPK